LTNRTISYLLFILLSLAAIPATVCALGDAVDSPSLEWLTGGDSTWFSQTSTTYDGIDAAQSADINDNQSSWIETDIDIIGSGTISFYWKVSSEHNFDFLRFYIDDIMQAEISSDVDWTQETFVIPAGTHNLKWSYEKDGSISYDDDSGWLDNEIDTLAIFKAHYLYGDFDADGDIDSLDLSRFGNNFGMIDINIFDDFDSDDFSEYEGDCNDYDDSVNPIAGEICDDGIDNNCDGVIDEEPCN